MDIYGNLWKYVKQCSWSQENCLFTRQLQAGLSLPQPSPHRAFALVLFGPQEEAAKRRSHVPSQVLLFLLCDVWYLSSWFVLSLLNRVQERQPAVQELMGYFPSQIVEWVLPCLSLRLSYSSSWVIFSQKVPNGFIPHVSGNEVFQQEKIMHVPIIM